ncbi:MAG: hypothetical protein KAR45_17830, partial [Desulfobacteraceae bacterium]|nr:hypothetical protein [Desulfobacteraceae bacterium]
NFKYAAESFGVLNVFAVQRNDKGVNANVNLFGAQFATKLGMVGLNAEINIFGGDQDTRYGSDDYKGQQLFVQATLNPSEKFMVAFQGLYAKGYDGANEVQVHQIGFDSDLGTFSPFDYGIMGGEHFDLCTTGLEYLGDNAGVVGLNVIADFKVAEGILIQGSLGWIQPEEDNSSNYDGGAIVFNIGATFDIATNTKFGVQYNQVAVDGDTGISDDAAQSFMAALYLNF